MTIFWIYFFTFSVTVVLLHVESDGDIEAADEKVENVENEAEKTHWK